MKKWGVVLVLSILLFVGVIYYFIPTNQRLAVIVDANCNSKGAERILLTDRKIESLWPEKHVPHADFVFKGFTYRFKKYMLNGLEVSVIGKEDSIMGQWQFSPAPNNKLQLKWVSALNFSMNPFKRILQYFRYVKFKENISELFSNYKQFLDNEENIYGFKVDRIKVAAISMISLKRPFSHLPSTEEIYRMINGVKEYIQRCGGVESDFPMLNIHTEDSVLYEAMVAIPTNTTLETKENFILKKFQAGYMLVTEIKGGLSEINQAEKNLKYYLDDNNKTSPAIPFQSLIINRMEVKDSSKWITKLSYPVFY
jgi:effector-binding domain-containing protein